MAPRSKRPKKGLRRKDAALDAMRLLGFSDQLVRKSINDLLKVYGDEGWVFIEEAAYKLLIETILEKQAEESNDHEPQPQIPLAPAETSSANEIISTNFQENSQEPVDKEVCEEHDPANVTPVKLCVREKCDENEMDIGSVPLLLKSSLQDLAPLHSTPLKDTVQSKKIRKPCYGWISDDSDEDEKDFVSLHAAKQVNKV